MKRIFAWFPRLILFCLIVIVIAPLCASGQNPVPFLNQPLVPGTVAPGSPGFTLTVNGGNFTANSVVNWNGQALETTYVSATQLTACVPAEDVAAAGTAHITVSNPAPSAASLPTFFPVLPPTSALRFKQASTIVGSSPVALAMADFDGDGKLDLVYANNISGTTQPVQVSVQLGNGDGTFRQGQTFLNDQDATGGAWVLAGDFNGDGKTDLVYSFEPQGEAEDDVALGNGDGTFQAPGAFLGGIETTTQFVIGDFNRDGFFDWANLDNFEAGVLRVFFDIGPGATTGGSGNEINCCGALLSVGDFNGDGILDLTAGTGVMLGDGNGNFGAPLQESSGAPVVADFNGDGILDLVNGSLYLGNGDGTFTLEAQSNIGPCAVAADFNGDGKLDCLGGSGNTISISFGNGEGTFQNPVTYAVDYPVNGAIALGDFNNDGYLDVAYTSGTRVVILLGGADTSRVPTSVKLISSLNPSNHGQLVTFTATAGSRSGTPQGKITFLDGTTPLATRKVSAAGEATFGIYDLSIGSHNISAVYGGNSDFAPSRSRTLLQIVQK